MEPRKRRGILTHHAAVPVHDRTDVTQKIEQTGQHAATIKLNGKNKYQSIPETSIYLI